MSMINTGFRIDAQTNKKLENIAKNKRRKTSELIRMIIEDYVKQFDDMTIIS